MCTFNIHQRSANDALPKDKPPRHAEIMFKNGNLRDHLERAQFERTDINEDDSLTVTFVFKPDTTIAVASPTPIRPVKCRKVKSLTLEFLTHA
jgi:hypothetical protein